MHSPTSAPADKHTLRNMANINRSYLLDLYNQVHISAVVLAEEGQALGYAFTIKGSTTGKFCAWIQSRDGAIPGLGFSQLLYSVFLPTAPKGRMKILGKKGREALE